MGKSEGEELEEFLEEDLEKSRLERKVKRLERQLLEKKRSIKVLQKEVEIAEERLDFSLALEDFSAAREIKPRKSKGRNEVTAILGASDWHVGELVDPKTVNGRNEYTPEIAAASAELFFQNGLRLIETQRASVDIDELILWLGGDMITGYIHEELMENNPLSPTEETELAADLCIAGIDFLLEHGKFKRIQVVCSIGNHGRTSQKRKVATAAKNSYEWLMYRFLKKQYRNVDAVEFTIASGAHVYVDVYGKTIRFHHGDDVRYWGGVGGLSVPLRKATDKWDDFIPADLTIIGHYHQLVDYGYAMVNGSLKGFDPFALSVKAGFEEPRQLFCLIDKHYGKTIVAPIYVRERMSV